MTRTMAMTAADHVRVSEAVHAAELGTAGEIVSISADVSDSYGDVAMWWAIGATIVALGLLAAFPDVVLRSFAVLSNGWVSSLTLAEAFELALAVVVITFGLVRLALTFTAIRIALTPSRVKAARVRKRALGFFKVGAERRTTGRTGILIYVSLSEHRAEIVADEAIHSLVANEAWGAAMADLIGEVRQGRLADGLIAAVRDVGVILAQHFPRSDDDINELPDRLIEL